MGFASLNTSESGAAILDASHSRQRPASAVIVAADMRNLMIGLLLGVLLGVSSTLVAQRRPEPVPDAVTAYPRHYRVAFENDVARFLRVTYGPGEKSVMHRHLPGCAIFLTDQTMNFTLPDGSTDLC